MSNDGFVETEARIRFVVKRFFSIKSVAEGNTEAYPSDMPFRTPRLHGVKTNMDLIRFTQSPY